MTDVTDEMVLVALGTYHDDPPERRQFFEFEVERMRRALVAVFALVSIDPQPTGLGTPKEMQELHDLRTYVLPEYNRFQEWAQSVLDVGRWAGHSRTEAIITEWQEREERLTQCPSTHLLGTHLNAITNGAR